MSVVDVTSVILVLYISGCCVVDVLSEVMFATEYGYWLFAWHLRNVSQTTGRHRLHCLVLDVVKLKRKCTLNWV